MLITLGAKRETSDAPLDLLEACHGRIRRFLSLARAVGARELPKAEAVDVAGQVVRYFRVAFPLHLLDEDLSLFPRLQGREPAVDAALARMRAEHPVVDAQLLPLVALCEAVHAEGEATFARRGALLALAPSIEQAFEAHLVHEEQVLFPAAKRLLTQAEQVALREELRARRMPGA
jgi:hemerythrin-like domain-containing protein